MKLLLIILLDFITGTLCLSFGVRQLSTGLENINKNRMKNIIRRFTSNVFTAFITGIILTALVQSSTAITIMTVGFVNSGLMQLTQAVGIIYGANIGTTVTAQLMSFRLTDYALYIIAAGLVINLVSRKHSVKGIAKAITGFGLMFLGLKILNTGVPLIKESETVYNLFLTYGKNQYTGLIIGIIITMLVQSSSATVGLTIVLFNAGLISFEAALGLTIGDNIGTCITAQIASIGTNLSARRTAWSHTLYNIIGAVCAIILLKPFANLIIAVTSALGQDKTRLIANAHTIFNVLSAIVFLPLTKLYVKFIETVVHD
ncbi:MAG TPA: Na/Pi cotransporter family protein [Clostridiaceae bacterium]|nr:Na/Pi cotransporter family protein [Clostridiaceae bacterium]